jgi:hypothetical protein
MSAGEDTKVGQSERVVDKKGDTMTDHTEQQRCPTCGSVMEACANVRVRDGEVHERGWLCAKCQITIPARTGVRPCKYGDPTCPCQDGDMCHYEGEDPWHKGSATEPTPQCTEDCLRKGYSDPNCVAHGVESGATAQTAPKEKNESHVYAKAGQVTQCCECHRQMFWSTAGGIWKHTYNASVECPAKPQETTMPTQFNIGPMEAFEQYWGKLAMRQKDKVDFHFAQELFTSGFVAAPKAVSPSPESQPRVTDDCGQSTIPHGFYKVAAPPASEMPRQTIGIDLAYGSDKTVYRCTECGISDTPCKHAVYKIWLDEIARQIATRTQESTPTPPRDKGFEALREKELALAWTKAQFDQHLEQTIIDKAAARAQSAELDRLRGAAQEIIEACKVFDGKCEWGHTEEFAEIANQLRAALAPSEGPKEGV